MKLKDAGHPEKGGSRSGFLFHLQMDFAVIARSQLCVFFKGNGKILCLAKTDGVCNFRYFLSGVPEQLNRFLNADFIQDINKILPGFACDQRTAVGGREIHFF